MPKPSSAAAEDYRKEHFHADRLKPLAREFFLRDPRLVARELLGKVLLRRDGCKLLAGRIVEDEAYLGVGDPAAHAAAGRTPRNAVLFGPPGFAYVYFIYGNHYCLNVSCLPEGDAGCVLIRALKPLAGIEEMALNRKLELDLPEKRVPHSSPVLARVGEGAPHLPAFGRCGWPMSKLKLLTSGPGRLTEALAITRPRDNGKDLLAPESDLALLDDGYRTEEIVTTARVGITKAAEAPLRYYVAGDPFVSGKR